MFEIEGQRTTDGQCWEYNNTGMINGRGIKYALQLSVHEEVTSSLPVPETKFNRPEGECWSS